MDKNDIFGRYFGIFVAEVNFHPKKSIVEWVCLSLSSSAHFLNHTLEENHL